MIKCFLSHSSADKDHYVRILAKNIRKEAKVFDEETFEAGMSPLEEIMKGLDESSLFVVFLSNSALASKWVNDELLSAKALLDESKLARIYPIIIEPGLQYDDPRIPDWMRENLNIQPILRPTIAARKINARLIELSWAHHPRLKQRKEIFVGRNDLITSFEQRLDDFSQPTPVAVIASGLPAIGRKSFLQSAAKKANLVRDSYEFPVVSLTANDGIEEFILKIADLGFIPTTFNDLKLATTFSEKLELAKKVCDQIIDEKERIIIEDKGIIVQGNREIVDWFIDVVGYLGDRAMLCMCIASQFRPNPALNRINPLFFTVHVPELEVPERNGLLLRYSKFHELNLNRDDLSFFSDLLTGYPEQVLFTVDLIKEQGIFTAKKSSHMVQQYASDKAKTILDIYKSDTVYLEFIYLLCRFEFISYDALFDIVDHTKYGPILDRLLASSVCERMGASSDYVRINEVVRDYVGRSQFKVPSSFENAIKSHVKRFLEKYEDDNPDVSDYLFSAQELLRSGNDVPDDIVIPSVFISAIKRLYSDRSWDDAIALADRVLAKEKFLHINTVNHVRYIKCQCLARQRDPAFFNEVRKIPESDRSFLHGFYYRLSGDFAKAEESLNRVIANGRRDAGVVGELVLVYMQSDEYGLAYELAKENYRIRPSNPINANNYFACLIMKEKTSENEVELYKIITRLRDDPSERAQEMYYSAYARFVAYYENDEYRSMQVIEEAINKFERISYPILTKADLAVYFSNPERLREAVVALDGVVKRNAQTYRTYVRYKALLLAMEGKLLQAKELVKKELQGLIGSALNRLNEKLVLLSQNHPSK